MREVGNAAAHQADGVMIRDAVVNGGPEDLGALDVVFQFVYNKDL